jgi:hypothetical protein
MLHPALVLAELFWICQDQFELSQPKLASQPNPTYKVSGQDLVSGGRRRTTTNTNIITIIIIIPT